MRAAAGLALAAALLVPAVPAPAQDDVGRPRSRAGSPRPGPEPRLEEDLGAPGDRLGDPAGGVTPELREALRDFYLRALQDELGLSESQAKSATPRVEALLEAQRAGAQDRVRSGLGLLAAARQELDATGAARDQAAAALQAARESERAVLGQLAEAREGVVRALTPRQAARFLAFEGRFQERVRQVLGGDGGSGRGDGPPGDPQGPRAGWDGRPGGADPPQGGGPRRDAPPPPPPRGEGPGGGERDEALRTAVLVFTHQLRQQLALTDAQALALVPKVEELARTRMDAERERRRLHERLLAAAGDPDASDDALRSLVAQGLALEAEGPRRVSAAREALVAGMGPVAAARALVLEHRAEREMRDMARRARQGWGGGRGRGPGAGAPPGDGSRPAGGPPEGRPGRPGRGGGGRRPGGLRPGG